MEFENLLKLINAVSSSALSEFKYEERDVKLFLAKNASGQVAVTTGTETSSVTGADFVSKEPVGNIVKSPLVGTFYAASSEDAAPFVSVGDKVEKGQILAIVEAMKLMNDIESEFAGEIAEVYVKNGDAVEYGQPLFRIK